MPNLVSVNRFSSLQMLNKTQTGVFLISGFLVKSPVNRSCRNSGNSKDIDMKLEPVTKLDKRNRNTSKKKLTMTSCQQIIVSPSFFQLMVDLEQSETWILGAWSIIPTFSLTEFFLSCKYRKQIPHTNALSKGIVFAKTC